VVSTTKAVVWRSRGRQTACAAVAIAAIGGGALATAGSSLASLPAYTICKGSFKKPGVLSSVPTSVVIKGACEVSRGAAKVEGNVTVSRGSVLLAAFAHDVKTHKGHGDLTVTGNLRIDKGATAILGCEAAHFPCIDDSPAHPKFANKVTIGGNLISTGALGTILHVTKIAGKVVQTGGGGGESCAGTPGVFGLFKSPQYSDYEDVSIGGKLSISNLSSCWLGVLRVHVAKGFTLNGNAMADPDAMEIGNNVIGGNLACNGNTNAVPASAAIWDSHEANATNGTFYPRVAEPNTVKGERSGQCDKSTPLTAGGPYGAPGTF
jgi:hypothetical protein